MSVGRYAYVTGQAVEDIAKDQKGWIRIGDVRAKARRAWRKSGKRRSFQSFIHDIRQGISRSNTHGGAQQ